MSSLILGGDSSGTITLTVPSAAGTNTITLPALTGTAITTASTSGIPGTVNWTTVQTSSVSPAVAGTGYPMNTTSGALTVTLPASPSAGQMISIVDYAGTFATNNLTVNPNGNKIQGGTTSATLSTNREAINLVYVDSTQGWLAYSDVYSTTAPLPQVYTASYLVVAGGAGGFQSGVGGNGGGGAGGYITGTLSLSAGTVYTAVVGAGGARSTNGSNSTFTGVTTAVGGGTGCGGTSPSVGASGGSGGGGGETRPGGSGTPGQGYNGGNGNPTGGGGGGGGSGSVGATSTGGAPATVAGQGGDGTANSITGSSVIYAGGGGGSGYGPYTPGISGLGGPGTPGVSGGNGAVGGNGSTSTGGVANTGGGGGAQNTTATGVATGGSGVVIISVPTANYTGTTTGSPTITTSGSNTIIKWTSVGSGTYTA